VKYLLVFGALLGLVLFGCVSQTQNTNEINSLKAENQACKSELEQKQTLNDLFADYRQVGVQTKKEYETMKPSYDLMNEINITSESKCKTYYTTYDKVYCNIAPSESNMLAFLVKYGTATNNSDCVEKATGLKSLIQEKVELCSDWVNKSKERCYAGFNDNVAYDYYMESKVRSDDARKKYNDKSDAYYEVYDATFYLCFSK